MQTGDITLAQLGPADVPALQALLERCADLSLLVEGEPPSPQAAELALNDLPPGKELADKFLFGVFREHVLIGVLDAVRDYPEEGIWWIGLLLLDPGQRSHGAGKLALDLFEDWARAQGARLLRLGVVEENRRGYRFWQRMGFALIEKRAPRRFGQKDQAVRVMQLPLHAPESPSSPPA